MDIDMTNSKRQMAEDTRKRIAELWNLGWTSSKISEEIGITRNSVVGAIHRLRQKGEILVSAEEKRHKNRKPRPKKILAIRKNMRKPLELGQPVGIMKLTSRSCRFIVAEGGMEELRHRRRGRRQRSRAHLAPAPDRGHAQQGADAERAPLLL